MILIIALTTILVLWQVLPRMFKIHKRPIVAALVPIRYDDANNTIDDYRKNGAFARLSLSRAPKLGGIAHKFSEWNDFVVFFKGWVTNHQVKILPNHEWQVGIYPALYEDAAGHPRLAMYLIPTMVDISGGANAVKDYNDYRDSVYYLMRDDNSNEDINKIVWDQGTIFP